MTIDDIIYLCIRLVPTFVVLAACLYNIFTGKSTTNNIKELLSMYRSTNYQSTTPEEGQTFDPMKTQYAYDAKKDELVELPEKVNMQELIQSSVTTCFEETLKRLMPENVQEVAKETSYVELGEVKDDLDMLIEANEILCDYRERLSLPDNMPDSDVYRRIQEYANGLSDKIKRKEVNNGVQTQTSQSSEPSDVETRQSQSVQSDSSQSA